MAAAFLYSNLADTAAFIGDTATEAMPALPLANLRDPQPRVRSRWSPATVGLYLDFGAAVEIACVALIGTSFDADASPLMNILFGNDAGFGSTNWNTGAFAPATDAACGGNVVVVHPTSVNGRYMQITLSGGSADHLDVGRLVIGNLFRLTYAWSFGAGEGRLMLDRRDRNGFTGAEFPVPAVVNPRMMTFTLASITAAEAIGEFRAMQDALGAAGDALWIPNDGLSLAEMNRRAIWGAVAQPGESSVLVRANFRQFGRSFSISERV